MQKKCLYRTGETKKCAFVNNSFGTFMLSAILQKVTGEKVVDYMEIIWKYLLPVL